jgi:hypothetical protein
MTGTTSATPERCTVLVICNSAYESGPLKNPANDGTDIALRLGKYFGLSLGFFISIFIIVLSFDFL